MDRQTRNEEDSAVSRDQTDQIDGPGLKDRIEKYVREHKEITLALKMTIKKPRRRPAIKRAKKAPKKRTPPKKK